MTAECVGTAAEASAFVTQQHEAFCQQLVSCTTYSDAVFEFFVLNSVATPADCVQLLNARRGSPQQHAAAVTQQRASFDKCEATTCQDNVLADMTCGDLIDYISSITANDVTRPFASCYGAFEGTVANDQGCTITAECGPGLACHREDVTADSGPIACQGTCQPEVESIAGTCDPVVCDSLNYCADTENGICFPRKAASEPCAPGECALDALCSDAGVCVANQGGRAIGQTCDNEQLLCGPGTYCDASVGTCSALLAPGESCPGLLCTFGNACDPTSNTCVPAAAAGASCTIDSQCQSQRCAQGTCADINALCP